MTSLNATTSTSKQFTGYQLRTTMLHAMTIQRHTPREAQLEARTVSHSPTTAGWPLQVRGNDRPSANVNEMPWGNRTCAMG